MKTQHAYSVPLTIVEERAVDEVGCDVAFIAEYWQQEPSESELFALDMTAEQFVAEGEAAKLCRLDDGVLTLASGAMCEIDVIDALTMPIEGIHAYDSATVRAVRRVLAKIEAAKRAKAQPPTAAMRQGDDDGEET